MEQVVKAQVSTETFSEFLDEQHLLEEAEAVAIKRLIALQLRDAMVEQSMTKTKMAELMKTDRRQLDRLLDPDNTSMTLLTLFRAAKVLGRQLSIEIG